MVVRASTRATVYAFFSMAAADAATRSSAIGVPLKKAMVLMLACILRTVSCRCSSLSAHSAVMVAAAACVGGQPDWGSCVYA